MPTILTHGISAVLIGKMFLKEAKSKRFWFWSMVCAIFPDIDVIGFLFGIKYGDFWGHRGFTHSLLFALLSGLFIASVFYRRYGIGSKRWFFWVFYYFMIMCSHGFFDMLTDGGLGIAYFAPFSNERFFFPMTPILVAPIGIGGIFSWRGVQLFLSEFMYVILPLAILLFVVVIWRKSRVEIETETETETETEAETKS